MEVKLKHVWFHRKAMNIIKSLFGMSDQEKLKIVDVFNLKCMWWDNPYMDALKVAGVYRPLGCYV